MNLLQQFKDHIKANDLFSPKDKLLLAVSGGVDSVGLCELCKQAGYDFVIAHCNFMLRGGESKRDEQFVRSLSDKYNVPVYARSFSTEEYAEENKLSIQEAARKIRYEYFDILIKDDIARYLLTAHHADDNIETLLMNFLRGTGLRGLTGIPAKNGYIRRPLLPFSKEELISFAKENELEFVEDSSNQSSKYTRNFFRNELIPAIEKVYPQVKENLLNNIGRFSEAEQLCRQSIDLHKKNLIEQKGNEFHIPVLKLKQAMPLRSIIYEIISDFNFTANQTSEVIGLLDSETGKYVASSTHRVIRNRNWLIISPLELTASSNIVIEEGIGNVQYAMGNLQLAVMDVKDCQLPTANSAACLDLTTISFPLLLRKWKQGDYFYPLGMKKKKKLARFFIDNKFSTPQKENAWVIESDKKIVWVVGHRIDDRCKVTDKTKKTLRLSLHS
ncbi:MAG: tRNA lysidine(34) synthetase TilS [Chitinophagaceae bacterium]|nr:tRNA lysidine(34) synthetase TilS [Chitinophagaceae bacterium]